MSIPRQIAFFRGCGNGQEERISCRTAAVRRLPSGAWIMDLLHGEKHVGTMTAGGCRMTAPGYRAEDVTPWIDAGPEGAHFDNTALLKLVR